MTLSTPYTDYDPLVPVRCATPGEGRVIHRFFDTSPVSPSGRFLALTRFPFEDRSPKAGDMADIVVVDLETGEERFIASTPAWGSQLGAQVQWGAVDEDLFFNDMNRKNWKPYGVRYNIVTGERQNLAGTIYHVSPDGHHAVSPCLIRTNRTQLGYGVMVPDNRIIVNQGAPDDDGVFITDTQTGESRLLVSINAIVAALPHFAQPQYEGGDFYAFHTKWSPDGSRIMVILRWTPRVRGRWWRKSSPASKRTMRKFVVTVAADGSDVRTAITDDQWARGGHHPAWHPDSRHITMNLNLGGDDIDAELRFVTANIDGDNVELLHPTAVGSGHPSLHPGGRFLLTDAYPNEVLAYGDGTVPIRLLDLQTGREQVLARIMSKPHYVGSRKEMRLDAHPAWDRSGDFVIFNGCPDGTRRVYVADVSTLVR